MPNPKKKHSRARKGSRRANWKIALQSLTLCPQCKSPKLPHHICPECGFYDNQMILVKKEKTKEKEK